MRAFKWRESDYIYHFHKDSGWDEYKDPQIVNWKRVRAVIEHENMLINHRITWLLLSQGFLLALLGSLGAACAKKAGDLGDIGMQLCKFLASAGLPVLMLAGIFICLVIAVTVSHAEIQIRSISNWWDKYFSHFDPNRPAINRHPHGHPAIFRSKPSGFFGYMFRYSLLASGFAGLWLAALLVLLMKKSTLLAGSATATDESIHVILGVQLVVLSAYVGHGVGEFKSTREIFNHLFRPTYLCRFPVLHLFVTALIILAVVSFLFSFCGSNPVARIWLISSAASLVALMVANLLEHPLYSNRNNLSPTASPLTIRL